ncbi:uncharacterized protein [Diadema antillarum]|uniref:uncharacterized protein n=1 Tax=Diadema antillarum TaxID=105358 RepID=UPI003A8C5ABE
MVCLMREVMDGGAVRWRASLTGEDRIDVDELCTGATGAPTLDSCSLCDGYVEPSTPTPPPLRPPSNQGGTEGEGDTDPTFIAVTGSSSVPGGTYNFSADPDGETIPGNLRTIIIVAFSVVGGLVIILVFVIFCLVCYIRRKINGRVRDNDSSVRAHYRSGEVNRYSAVQNSLSTNRASVESRPVFSISPQTSIESGSPSTNRKSMKSKKSLASSTWSRNPRKSSTLTACNGAPYTEYYPDRGGPSYAGLQTVVSDSALVGMAPFSILSEYQEPEVVLPKSSNPPLFESFGLTASSSSHSFKPPEYAEPEETVRGASTPVSYDSSGGSGKSKRNESSRASGEITPDSGVAKHFKQKCEDTTTSPTSSMWRGLMKGKQKKGPSASCKVTSSASPDGQVVTPGKEGILYHELVQTLNKKKKKPLTETNSTPPLETDAENPYAEVGEVSFESSCDFTTATRPRSHSQPMVSTLSGYRTYEEIKPYSVNSKDKSKHSHDANTATHENHQYSVLEESKETPSTQYFVLENPADDMAAPQYFQLEKPNSLPLNKKNTPKRTLDTEKMLYSDQHMDKTATIYKNDTCAVKVPGSKNKTSDRCIDSDNGLPRQLPVYFQLERSRERASLGSTIQEYMSSSENVFANDGNRLPEGTLTYFPGGRKRSSTYSLEEQAYDKLNRSARSSRRSSGNQLGAPPSTVDGAYAMLSPSEETSVPVKGGSRRSKSLRK